MGRFAIRLAVAGAGLTVLVVMTNVAAARVQKSPAMPLACKPASIGGKEACLAVGKPCKARFNAQYRRYGFRCRNGHLEKIGASSPPKRPDLVVTLSDSPDPVAAGGALTYVISIQNVGTAAASDVRLTFLLGTGLVITSKSPSQGSCPAASATSLDCEFGDIAVGATASATVTARADAPGTITTSASVSSSPPDSTQANNSASTTTVVNPPVADLSITLTDAPDPVSVGANITYTATVINAGPNTSDGVHVTDALPAGLSLVSATSSPGTCGGSTTVDCTISTLAPSGRATVTIVARTTAAGSVSNSAAASSSTSDPNAANNSASTTTTVAAAPPPPPANCAPSYPDVCIPPPPPDLNCSDIPYRNFRVIYSVPNPDPHGFDRDHDGIGCEK